MRVGAITWDASVPSTEFVGHYVTKSLSPEKYRRRTPFYADILSENKIDFHYRSLEEYERELQYAIDAGIDYFIYCWYDPEKYDLGFTPLYGEVESEVYTISYTRKLHLKSNLRKKIKLCGILMAYSPVNDKTVNDLIDAFDPEHYEYVGDKPLVFMYGGYNCDAIKQLKQHAAKRGFDPYIAFLNTSGTIDDSCLYGGSYSMADAVSAYTILFEDSCKYADMYNYMITDNENRKKYGLATIPVFTMGYDPHPRIDSPVPWTIYKNTIYPVLCDHSELLEGAKMLTEWIKQNPQFNTTDHIVTFSWNEFEEGGYICPTYAEDGSVDTSRIQIFKQISDYFKDNL